MYKTHIWFGPAHENMGPKKKNHFFFKKKVIRLSFSSAAPEKAPALKTPSCLYARTFILTWNPRWMSLSWPVGGSIAPSVLVRRDPQKPHGWNVMLCASEPFTSHWLLQPAPPRRCWNQPHPLWPVAVKSSNRANQPARSYFYRIHLHFRVSSSPTPFHWRVRRRLSPLHGALRANNFLTWQNGEELTHRNLAVHFLHRAFPHAITAYTRRSTLER